MTGVYRVPRLFFEDYFDRFDGTDLFRQPLVWAVRGRQVEVHLTEKQARDLLSDAIYYSDTSDGFWEPSVRPLNDSAKRTVKALLKQGLSA